MCDSDRAYAENPPPDLPAAYKESLLSDLSRGSFGVNTGLYSRTLASGDKVLSTLTGYPMSLSLILLTCVWGIIIGPVRLCVGVMR